jgi:hypothetical protein
VPACWKRLPRIILPRCLRERCLSCLPEEGGLDACLLTRNACLELFCLFSRERCLFCFPEEACIFDDGKRKGTERLTRKLCALIAEQ